MIDTINNVCLQTFVATVEKLSDNKNNNLGEVLKKATEAREEFESETAYQKKFSWRPNFIVLNAQVNLLDTEKSIEELIYFFPEIINACQKSIKKKIIFSVFVILLILFLIYLFLRFQMLEPDSLYNTAVQAPGHHHMTLPSSNNILIWFFYLLDPFCGILPVLFIGYFLFLNPKLKLYFANRNNYDVKAIKNFVQISDQYLSADLSTEELKYFRNFQMLIKTLNQQDIDTNVNFYLGHQIIRLRLKGSPRIKNYKLIKIYTLNLFKAAMAWIKAG